MSAPGRLATKRMLVVSGKGGVGKTLVTAALGDALARAGRRVLLVEVDPRESLYHLLAAAPSGGERVPVSLQAAFEGARPARHRNGALWLQNLQPRHVIEQMVRDLVHVDLLTRRVLGSTIFQHFVESAPGLKELAVLGYAMRALDARDGQPADVDTIILDAPATGHGVSLLAAPSAVAQVLEEGPFGRMAREMTAFVADPSRLGILVVTRAEALPALEARELFAMLETRVKRSPDLLVVNALYPPLPSPLPTPALPESIAGPWAERRQTNERELASLSTLDVPLLGLPLLPIDNGPRLVTALGRELASTLDVAAEAA